MPMLNRTDKLACSFSNLSYCRPENFLSYYGFDDTPDKGYLKSWSPHSQDYNAGDPTWAGGNGIEIIGGETKLSLFL